MPKTDQELTRAIGYRLRLWREDKGGVQKKAFWPRYGLDPAKMGRYENGKETPSPDKIVEICQKTGISADYLLSGKKETAARPGKPSHWDKRVDDLVEKLMELHSDAENRGTEAELENRLESMVERLERKYGLLEKDDEQKLAAPSSKTLQAVKAKKR